VLSPISAASGITANAEQMKSGTGAMWTLSPTIATGAKHKRIHFQWRATIM
jgi:hypothetical protein